MVRNGERLKRRLEDWKSRLVDLTRRNRLLFFRRTKSTTVRILRPELDLVFARLAVEQKSMEFWSPEENSSGELLPGLVPSEELGMRGPQSRGDDEIVTDISDSETLSRILGALHRRAASDYREKGVRILYLSCGILHWQEAEGTDTIRSPILLLPLELVRESAREPFTLSPLDEDPVLNPALQIKLRKDFRVALPSLPEDWEGTTPGEYLRSVDASVRPLGWHTEMDAYLSLFSFYKLVIYQDLTNNEGEISKHLIVRALAREEQPDWYVNDVPTERDLDSAQPPADTYQILDADSSQQVCIQAAVRGQSFVMHGPPGTGKSQTIANIIGECISRGKTALFVSEKMAALEVVFRRLRAAHLDQFCLELHSAKTNKREVTRELAKTLEGYAALSSKLSRVELDRLTKLRSQLNAYVVALHKRREPWGRSAFEVLSELGRLEELVTIPLGNESARTWDEGKVVELEGLIRRLGHVWHIVEEGENFPWRGFIPQGLPLEEQATLTIQLREVSARLSEASILGKRCAERLGVPPPASVERLVWTLQLETHLSRSPSPDPGWIRRSDLSYLKATAIHWKQVCERYSTLRQALLEQFSERIFALAADIPTNWVAVCSALGQSLRLDGEKWDRLLTKRHRTVAFVEATLESARQWALLGHKLAQSFGLPTEDITPATLERLARLGVLSASEMRPEAAWFDPIELTQVQTTLAIAEREYAQLASLRIRLAERFDEHLLECDLDVLIQRFSGIYRVPIRWVLPRYYRDRNLLRQNSRAGHVSSKVLEDLILARDVKRLTARLQQGAEGRRKILGRYFREEQTDFGVIRRAVGVAEEAINLLPHRPIPSEVVTMISGPIVDPELAVIGRRINADLERWNLEVESVRAILPLEELPTTGQPADQSSLGSILDWSQTVLPPLKEASGSTDAVSEAMKSPGELSYAEISAALRVLQDCRLLEQNVAERRGSLAALFGHRFQGMTTDWVETLKAIDWTESLQGYFPGGVSDSAAQLTISYTDPEGILPELAQLSGLTRKALHDVVDRLGATPFFRKEAPSERIAFPALHDQCQVWLDRIGELRAWIDYVQLLERFERDGLRAFVDSLETQRVSADDLVRVFRKSLGLAWLKSIYRDDPVLGEFRGRHHEELIAEFRRLDRLLVTSGGARAISTSVSYRPQNGGINAGEKGLLRAEALKKRRHLPLRVLFERIPNLLPRLKPCLLMSPISVSQFLHPSLHRFDLVVFDEASQMCTEDAVGSIYRGNQALIAGDNKQLPPTAFFQLGEAEEYEYDDTADEPLGDLYDSILDEAQALGMPTRRLRWHYRSRHEDLIAFSNHRFYDKELITFPAPYHGSHPTLGVSLRLVPDGVYDRGGRRDNLREAAAVAEMVFDHFRRSPEKTLGVIAFSLQQAEAIHRELELRRRAQPAYEPHFREDRLEGFFVKNLENVQGDERDVIFFSVGYGRDAQGRMTAGFGPLNKTGGERRLNVAVTRAREQVIVVSSIRASDIDLKATQVPGVLNLHRYLDYAERGIQALELSRPEGSGEPESDLEAQVGGAIQSLGYDVMYQVGCSGYRIDLGVVDSAFRGRFILGVECDGATYHSAATARDRDRLREQVLRDLGWEIHRIWAPEWVQNRTKELERLRLAIESARSIKARPPRTEEPIKPESERVGQTQWVHHKEPDEWPPAWTVPYEVCDILTPQTRGRQIHDPLALDEVCRLVIHLVRNEGPLHKEVIISRIYDAWGLKRGGRRVQAAIHSAILRCRESGKAEVLGDFVWPAPIPEVQIRTPQEGTPETHRPISYVPSEEIQATLIKIVESAVGISREDLIVQTARIFGWNRTGEAIRGRLLEVIETLLATGKLQAKDQMITKA